MVCLGIFSTIRMALIRLLTLTISALDWQIYTIEEELRSLGQNSLHIEMRLDLFIFHIPLRDCETLECYICILQQVSCHFKC